MGFLQTCHYCNIPYFEINEWHCTVTVIVSTSSPYQDIQQNRGNHSRDDSPKFITWTLD